MENRTGWGITCRESSRGWVIYNLLFCIWLEGDRGCFYKASNKFGWYHLRLTGYVGDVLANVVDIFSHNSIHSKLKISFHVLTHIKFHKEVLFLCVDLNLLLIYNWRQVLTVYPDLCDKAEVPVSGCTSYLFWKLNNTLVLYSTLLLPKKQYKILVDTVIEGGAEESCSFCEYVRRNQFIKERQFIYYDC